MKQNSIVIGCYAILILIGGIMGYVMAHSVVSLVVSGIFALVLLSCSILLWQGYSSAFQASLMTIFTLFLFFAYRYFVTFKIAPSGVMSIISALLLAYLYYRSAEKDLKSNLRS